MRRGCRSCCRSATAAWRSRRSPSSAEPRCPWRATSPTPRAPAWSRRSAGTPTCPTSGCSPPRSVSLVFDINDFDETLPGPWEWDVKRLAASLEIAARDNGFSAKQSPRDRDGSDRPVPRAMRTFADTTALDVWYAHADSATLQAYVRTAARQGPAQEALPRPWTRRGPRTTSARSAGSPRSTADSRGSSPTRR